MTDGRQPATVLVALLLAARVVEGHAGACIGAPGPVPLTLAIVSPIARPLREDIRREITMTWQPHGVWLDWVDASRVVSDREVLRLIATPLADSVSLPEATLRHLEALRGRCSQGTNTTPQR